MPSALEDPLGLPIDEAAAADELGALMGLSPPVVPKIYVKFPRDAAVDADGNAVPASRTVQVGCCANDAPDQGARSTKKALALGGNGQFEVEFDPETKAAGLFTATPDKGQCNAGAQTDVTFKFAPPDSEGSNGLDVGRWVKATATIHLRGAPTPGTFEVELEGYMPNL